MQTPRDCSKVMPNAGESGLPGDFKAARAAIHAAVAQVQADHAGDTLIAALMAETMPRLIEAYGPQAAAAILIQLATDIASGAAPNCTRQ